MEKEKQYRQKVLNSLLESKHGALTEYVAPALEAVKSDKEFLSKVIVWNLAKGEIRDTKIALPVLTLRGLDKKDEDLAENAVACLVSLDPRSLVKAYRFNKELSKSEVIPGGHRRMLETGMRLYLSHRERDMGIWDRVALQHRASLKELYAVSHFRPNEHAQAVLFDRKYKKGSVFYDVARLKTVPADEAAGIILNRKIPFQIALTALGRKKEEFIKNPELPLALMAMMTGQQLLSGTKLLQSMGVFESRVLELEYSKALERAKKDKRVSTLKATKASIVIDETATETEKVIAEKITKKLSAFQEEKLAQRTIEGDWVVLGDCSGSMHEAIKMAVEIASYLAKSVKGKVYLVFFNTMPRLFDVTGKSLEMIRKETSRISATGGTSCGCGLSLLAERKIKIDGIAIVSDGGDNTHPLFPSGYNEYRISLGNEPTVYFYHLDGERNVLTQEMKTNNIHHTVHEVDGVDYYSLPNFISQMKTTKYGLIDEIMSTPYLTFEDVFRG